MTIMIQSCEYSMKEVWTCANGGERHHRGCLTASDIHKAVRTRASLFGRPFLLHKEGPRFHRLFKDCDTDGDGCNTQQKQRNRQPVREIVIGKKYGLKLFANKL